MKLLVILILSLYLSVCYNLFKGLSTVKPNVIKILTNRG